MSVFAFVWALILSAVIAGVAFVATYFIPVYAVNVVIWIVAGLLIVGYFLIACVFANEVRESKRWDSW